MSDAKSNFLEGGLVGLIFNGTSIASLARNSASPSTSLVLALHTASPGETGTQDSNECTYTSYARLVTGRNSSEWSVTTAGVANPTTILAWPQATGGSETATYISISLTTNSTADLLYYGALDPTIAISNGVIPQVTSSMTISET